MTIGDSTQYKLKIVFCTSVASLLGVNVFFECKIFLADQAVLQKILFRFLTPRTIGR